MRFSLRELLILAAVVCVALAALLYANLAICQLTVAALSVTLMLATIHAVVARGRGQALALGLVVPALAYAALVFAGGDQEQSPWAGGYWTTRVLAEPVRLITARRSYWVDGKGNKTKERPEYPPGTVLTGNAFGDFGGGGVQVGAGGVPMPVFHQLPLQSHLMPIAHCLWALLFGYVGMKYAGWVYDRREGPEREEADEG